MKGMEGWKSLKNAWGNSRNQTSVTLSFKAYRLTPFVIHLFWRCLKGVKELLTVRTSKIPFKRCLTLFGSQNQRDVVLRKRIIRVSSFDSRNMGRPLTLIYTS